MSILHDCIKIMTLINDNNHKNDNIGLIKRSYQPPDILLQFLQNLTSLSNERGILDDVPLQKNLLETKMTVAKSIAKLARYGSRCQRQDINNNLAHEVCLIFTYVTNQNEIETLHHEIPDYSNKIIEYQQNLKKNESDTFKRDIIEYARDALIHAAACNKLTIPTNV